MPGKAGGPNVSGRSNLQIDTRQVDHLAVKFASITKQAPRTIHNLTLRIGNEMRDRYIITYQIDRGPGFRKPVRYTGRMGDSVAFYAPPGAFTVTLRINVPYGHFVEHGGHISSYNPGLLSIWAAKKFNLRGKQIGLVVRRIMENGLKAHNLAERAFSPTTPQGARFDQFVSETSLSWLENVVETALSDGGE
jgi:hypothetical protein